jgi:hypothetical protein
MVTILKIFFGVFVKKGFRWKPPGSGIVNEFINNLVSSRQISEYLVPGHTSAIAVNDTGAKNNHVNISVRHVDK